mmetsp:Transcript_5504/g.16415  ORF Transcript_5504/g.16415 Transcript_5504/m.16415 type:complete len:200 (+) Transcript_5504:908-1507(+)
MSVISSRTASSRRTALTAAGVGSVVLCFGGATPFGVTLMAFTCGREAGSAPCAVRHSTKNRTCMCMRRACMKRASSLTVKAATRHFPGVRTTSGTLGSFTRMRPRREQAVAAPLFEQAICTLLAVGNSGALNILSPPIFLSAGHRLEQKHCSEADGNTSSCFRCIKQAVNLFCSPLSQEEIESTIVACPHSQRFLPPTG